MMSPNMMVINGASLFQNIGSSLMMISPQTEKIRIKDLTSVHEATEQEIEQVYNHVLMEILK